ncbi:MAG: TspO/MBR family protein [Candidatus Nanohaloarchaea archaeon]
MVRPVPDEKPTFLASMAICFAAGAVGGLLSGNGVATWYPGLVTPWFTPPNWVFGPVWTGLYALMGVSLYLVARHGWRQRAVGIFAAHLALNVAWSFAFFGLRSPVSGLVVVLALLGSILWTIRAFRAVSREAAALLLPYLAWGGFAAMLNAAIVLLN